MLGSEPCFDTVEFTESCTRTLLYGCCVHIIVGANQVEIKRHKLDEMGCCRNHMSLLSLKQGNDASSTLSSYIYCILEPPRYEANSLCNSL
jgi:hypothetical protein